MFLASVIVTEAALWAVLRASLAVQRRRLARALAEREAAQERRYEELLAMVFGDPVVAAGLDRASPERRVQLEAGIYLEVAFIAYADLDALEAYVEGR